MSGKTGLRAAALIASAAVLLAVTAVAVGATSNSPTLGSPNHKHVAPGRIHLVVHVPLAAANRGVFIAIDPKRSRDKNGHLKGTCSVANGCDYVEPHHVSGHKYVYTAKGSFPGFWAVTPGKYYWQAQYFTVGDTANYYGPIGAFYVK